MSKQEYLHKKCGMPWRKHDLGFCPDDPGNRKVRDEIKKAELHQREHDEPVVDPWEQDVDESPIAALFDDREV